MKKLTASLLAAALAFSLAACSAGTSSAASGESTGTSSASGESAAFTGDGFDDSIDYAALAGTTIRVGASPTPHAEILAVAADILAQAKKQAQTVIETLLAPVTEDGGYTLHIQ